MRTNVMLHEMYDAHHDVAEPRNLARAPREWEAATPIKVGQPGSVSTIAANDQLSGLTAGEIFESFLAVIAIVIALPVMLLVGLIVVLQDAGRPIFVQQRIGRGGIPFPCLKFRTMVVDSQAQLERLLASDPEAAHEWATDQKLRNDPRITLIGAWLRKSSLDELPQLFNIAAGQMSFVGPRPIVDSEVSRYGRYFQHYISVRPGLTGLWQVSGRSDLTYRRRVVIDTVYVRTRSLALDLMIVLRTIPAMLTRRGSV